MPPTRLARRTSEPVDPASPGHGDRLPAPRPFAHPRRTVVPRVETTRASASPARSSPAPSMRHDRQAGRPDRSARPGDFALAVDDARVALASAEADYARPGPTRALSQSARHGGFTPQTRSSASRSPRPPIPGRAGAKPALLGREQPRLHRAALRHTRRRHRRAGRSRPGHATGPGRRAGGAHRPARDRSRRARAPVKTVREARAASLELWPDPGHRHPPPARALGRRRPDDPHLPGAFQHPPAAAARG